MSKNQMDSFENLSDQEARVKLKEIAEDCRMCMFVTNLSSVPAASRPMSIQEVDDEGAIWFISSSDSDKNKEIASDNRVQLYFQNNGSAEYLSIYGEASVFTDKATKDKYWTEFANAWFTGKDDPKVTIIKIRPIDCYYWDTKSGKFIAFMKRSLAALTGADVDDDGIEGKLKL